MADAFKLPRVRAADSITDASGKASNAFVRFWDTVMKSIERQENAQGQALAALQAVQLTQAAMLEQIQQALELAGLALETADGGTATKSASATAAFALSSTSFSPAVSVDLSGVSAGDLTIPGTGPSATVGTTSMTGGLMTTAEYQLVEIVSGVPTALFSGTFTINDITGDEPSQIFQVIHTSAADVAAFLQARTSTGAVTYQIRTRRVSGATMSGVKFYLFARRAA